MRQISTLVLAFILLIFALPATATDGTTLPDYETKMEVGFHGECDGGATKSTVYRSDFTERDFILVEVAKFSSGDMSYEVARPDKEAHYFWKAVGSTESPVELGKHVWHKKIKITGLKYYLFKSRHSDATTTHDCHVVDKS